MCDLGYRLDLAVSLQWLSTGSSHNFELEINCADTHPMIVCKRGEIAVIHWA